MCVLYAGVQCCCWKQQTMTKGIAFLRFSCKTSISDAACKWTTETNTCLQSVLHLNIRKHNQMRHWKHRRQQKLVPGDTKSWDTLVVAKVCGSWRYSVRCVGKWVKLYVFFLGRTTSVSLQCHRVHHFLVSPGNFCYVLYDLQYFCIWLCFLTLQIFFLALVLGRLYPFACV